MPEKVTSLNGLKVTLEYCSYNVSAHNKDYVKSMSLLFNFNKIDTYPKNVGKIHVAMNHRTYICSRKLLSV